MLMSSIPGLHGRGAVLTAALLLTLGAGCRKAPPDTDLQQHQITERRERGLIVQEVDLTGDGRPDIFNYFRERGDERHLVRKELDLNRNGKIDVISHFNDAGQLEKEEMDGDFDGNFDWVDYYQDGVRVMSEVDTNYDGVPNIWSYYEEGRIVRKERDTTGDGRIDYWERFDEDGRVITTGRDTTGDGKVDQRDD